MVAHPSMQGGYGSSPVIPQIRPRPPRFTGAIATDAGRELAKEKLLTGTGGFARTTGVLVQVQRAVF